MKNISTKVSLAFLAVIISSFMFIYGCACHKIDEKLVGLSEGCHERRKPEWIMNMI
ncbi:MAG: hypothetical protein IPP52_09375 [Ignavibacteria bacterium]|nr:hypothetical protein [Ignavibacteria bacterium]